MVPRPLQDSEWGERVLILMHKEMLTQMRRFVFYVDEYRHTHTHSGDNLSTAGNWMQIIIIILICAGYCLNILPIHYLYQDNDQM